jgi:hypothetical protein
MDLRIRLIGALIVACGLALCYGATDLWPVARIDSPPGSSVAGDLLRVAGACVVALFGVGNVLAGLAVVLRRTERD